MNLDETQSIRRFLAELCIADVSQIEDDASFLETGILDSIGFLELVSFLEQTFRVRIEDEELIPENMDSIRNILWFLERKRKT